METFTRRLDAEEAAILQDHILGLLSRTKSAHLDILSTLDGEIPEADNEYEDTLIMVMQREISRITDWLKNY